MAILIT